MFLIPLHLAVGPAPYDPRYHAPYARVDAGGRKEDAVPDAGDQPEPGRPHAPGYGIPSGSEELLPWGFVEERMADAR